MKNLFIMALLLTILPAQAQTISEQEARQIAESFYAQSEQSKLTGANTAVSVSLAYKMEAVSMPPPSFGGVRGGSLYVFNNPESNGFVIVAGDERAENSILGWSDNGPFDYDNAPCGLKALLELYSRSEERGVSSEKCNDSQNVHVESNLTPRSSLPAPRKSEASVAPLLTTQWNQEEPYWNECPVNDYGEHAYAGCVITAMAQVMNYWQWPKQGRGAHQNKEYSSQYRDLSQSTYEWENLVDNYQTTAYTDAQAEAIARLMADIGCAVDALYFGPQGTSALSHDVPKTLIKNFNYNLDAHNYGSWPGENENWNPDQTIKNELLASRPVLTGLMTLDGIGHQAVIDGFEERGNDTYFHFNFGWGGQNDGYYTTGRGTGGHNGIYGDELTIGIHPSDYPAVEKDNVFFNLYEDGACVMTIKDVTDSESGKIVIPSQVEYEGKAYDVTSIYDHAFRASNITSISFPGTIKTIPDYLFTGYRYALTGSRLRNVTFNEGIEEIGDSAFAWSKNLYGYLSLPSTIKRIGHHAFGGTAITSVGTEAKDFTIGRSNFLVRIFDGIENAKEIHPFGVSGLTGTFTIQPDCKYHPGSVSAQKVFIPASVNYELDTAIPEFGFEVDSNHPSLSSRDNVLYNKDMTTLLRDPNNDWVYTVPEGVQTIDKDAFRHTIQYLYLPMSIKHPDGVSGGTRYVSVPLMTPPSLEEGTITPSSETMLKVPVGSKAAYEQTPVWKDFGSINEVLFIDGPLVYDLSDSYGNLNAGYASVVGRNTAYNFDGKLVIPETITVNGKEYVVSSVDRGAFLYDKTLQTVSLNASIYSLGEGGEALVTCSNIHTVSVAGDNDDFRVIGDMLIYDEWGRNVLAYCPPMKKEGSTIVARDEVTIPSEVDEIGWNVFCDNLHSVTIPANVGSMKPTAFKRCADLMEVRCMGEEPPYYDTMYEKYGHSFNDNVFNPEHGTILYVPKGCKDNYTGEYRYVPEWYLFPDIREFDPTSIETVTVGVQQSGKAYNLQGQQIINEKLKIKNDRSLPKGIYIMNGKKIIVK